MGRQAQASLPTAEHERAIDEARKKMIVLKDAVGRNQKKQAAVSRRTGCSSALRTLPLAAARVLCPL